MCIFNRGETFRKVMLRISEIRSLLPKVTKILALTATATTALRLEVSQILGMSDPLVVSLSPCKPNIIYSVVPFQDLNSLLQPMVKKLQTEKNTFPRTILYCRRFADCAELYHSEWGLTALMFDKYFIMAHLVTLNHMYKRREEQEEMGNLRMPPL